MSLFDAGLLVEGAMIAKGGVPGRGELICLGIAGRTRMRVGSRGAWEE
jgi:hypothetical protein